MADYLPLIDQSSQLYFITYFNIRLEMLKIYEMWHGSKDQSVLILFGDYE